MKPGRPKLPLPPPTRPLTERVRLLVDSAHAGNIREAARFASIPYATLRDLYRGSVTGPGLDTLQRLATPYGLGPGWFLETGDENAPGPVAHRGLLPADPDLSAMHREGRGVEIPLAARPLYQVYSVLWSHLTALPPTRDRPILGGARDSEECRRRLTTFLLAPLLGAQSLGESVLRTTPPLRKEPDRDEWVEVLQALGVLWERALPELLRQAGRGAPDSS